MKILRLITYIACAANIAWPTIYGWLHPDLTDRRVFLDTWPCWVAALICVVAIIADKVRTEIKGGK